MTRQQIFDYLENQWEKSQKSFIGSNESELDFKECIADFINENFIFIDKKKKFNKIYNVVRMDGEKMKGVLKSIVCVAENDLMARSFFNESTTFHSDFFIIREIGFTTSHYEVVILSYNNKE